MFTVNYDWIPFDIGSDIPDVLQAIESEPHWFMLGLALRVRHNKLQKHSSVSIQNGVWMDFIKEGYMEWTSKCTLLFNCEQ